MSGCIVTTLPTSWPPYGTGKWFLECSKRANLSGRRPGILERISVEMSSASSHCNANFNQIERTTISLELPRFSGKKWIYRSFILSHQSSRCYQALHGIIMPIQLDLLAVALGFQQTAVVANPVLSANFDISERIVMPLCEPSVHAVYHITNTDPHAIGKGLIGLSL